jgi:hypothetical protein
MEPTRIEIAEIESQGRYDVWHNGELICRENRTPFLAAARVLLQRGADPDAILEKVRRGSDQVDMRAPIGKAAGLSVWEGDLLPRFAPYVPDDRWQDAISLEGAPSSQPAPETPAITSASPSRPRLGETADAYPGVVAVLAGDRRVITCRAGIQWILQVRKGGQWRSRSFCQTKAALIRCCGGSHPLLEALPDDISVLPPLAAVLDGRAQGPNSITVLEFQ